MGHLYLVSNSAFQNTCGNHCWEVLWIPLSFTFIQIVCWASLAFLYNNILHTSVFSAFTSDNLRPYCDCSVLNAVLLLNNEWYVDYISAKKLRNRLHLMMRQIYSLLNNAVIFIVVTAAHIHLSFLNKLEFKAGGKSWVCVLKT